MKANSLVLERYDDWRIFGSGGRVDSWVSAACYLLPRRWWLVWVTWTLSGVALEPRIDDGVRLAAARSDFVLEKACTKICGFNQISFLTHFAKNLHKKMPIPLNPVMFNFPLNKQQQFTCRIAGRRKIRCCTRWPPCTCRCTGRSPKAWSGSRCRTWPCLRRWCTCTCTPARRIAAGCCSAAIASNHQISTFCLPIPSHPLLP